MTETLQSQLARIKADAERGIGASSCDTLAMVGRLEAALGLIDDLYAKVERPPRIDCNVITDLAYERLQAANPHLTITRSQP